MNATSDDTGGFLGSKDIGGFGYGIGVSVGILLLITSITLASYFCTRSPPRPARWLGPEPRESVVVEVGLDEETIKSYPRVRYEADKAGPTSCSICLADYKPRDALRKLPECGHTFHTRCLDPWLRLRPTCPLCRTSPLATPLAEVVPLASAAVL